MRKSDTHKRFKNLLSASILALLLVGCVDTNSTQVDNISYESKQIDNHITDWNRSKAHVIAVLDAMPEEKLNFKPTEDVRSFSFELKHIIGSVYGMMSDALEIESPQVDIESIVTKADLAKALSNCYDWAIKSLEEYDTSKNSEIIEYFGTYKVSRERAIFKIYEHQAHHKSKAVANMRVAGAIPPAYFLFD